MLTLAPRALLAALPERPHTLLEPESQRPGPSGSFTVYSFPVDLRHGEVHMYDTRQYWDTQSNGKAQPLPADVVARYADGTRDMAVKRFEIDLVRRLSNGTETSVPLHELYLHHLWVQINNARNESMASFGSSFEYRNSRFAFQSPYRRVMHQPSSWEPFMHLINTRDPVGGFDGRASPLVQCPCTRQRRFNLTFGDQGGIDGDVVDPPFVCPSNIAGNPACALDTYVGGTRCCMRSNIFVVDTETECHRPDCAEKPVDRAYLKATLHYEDATPETRNVTDFSCCDMTSYGDGSANNEFDVLPRCAADAALTDECVVRFEKVLPLDLLTQEDEPDDPDTVAEYAAHARSKVEIAYILPHLHEGALSIELLDDVSNRTLCRASRDDGSVMYGDGTEAGNERGYITGFRTCTWGAEDAPVYERRHPMRLIAKYDGRRRITGAMARMVVSGHDRVASR